MSRVSMYPAVLRRRIAGMVLLGFAFPFIGALIWLRAHDLHLLLLSAVLFLCNLIRAALLARRCRSGRYEIIEGTCTDLRNVPFTKQKQAVLTDDDGIEYALRLGRQVKLRLGMRYRLYFTCSDETFRLGSEHFDYLLSANAFLGYEQLN